MTNVKLVKDCGLYPSYKKIIDFTGTKSEIITKQLSWIDTFEHLDIPNVNYNKFQNKLVLEMDYEEALSYTYAVMLDITGTQNKPQFFFVNEIENLTNGIEDQNPNIAIHLSLDPIMTFMGEWKLDECMIDRSHMDRWGNSNKPIRVTPNLDRVTGFYKSNKNTMITQKINNKNLLFICIAFTSDKLDYSSSQDKTDALYYGIFPVYTEDEYIYGVFAEGEHSLTGFYDTTAYMGRYPKLSSVIDGTFMKSFKIAPEDIVSISILPISCWDINSSSKSATFSTDFGLGLEDVNVTIENQSTSLENTVYWIGNSIPYTLDTHYTTQSQEVIGNKTRILVSEEPTEVGYSPIIIQVCTGEDLIESLLTMSLEYSYPIKPINGADADSKYEPALFMEPYIERHITDGKGQSFLKIPDNKFFEEATTSGVITTNIKQLLDGSNNSMMYYFDVPSSDGIIGAETIIPNETLYVVNDAWKTYALTQKDSDRQMVTNYAIKNAIDNLIYMSYGGALVGSRSAGEEGYIGRTPVQRNYVRVRGKDGRFTGGHWEESGGNSYLTATGKRVMGAIGLAGAASIVTSLVDAHVSWANQMEKEKMIQNQPAGLLQNGTGQSLLSDDLAYHRAIELKVDDISYMRAYENFRKYGYWVYKFEIPNINSRKYFNYLLTNGAIVKGAINQSIRDTIASIFDAGVTIFHYDSGDTKTRKLEYTDKENIEVSLL